MFWETFWSAIIQNENIYCIVYYDNILYFLLQQIVVLTEIFFYEESI